MYADVHFYRVKDISGELSFKFFKPEYTNDSISYNDGVGYHIYPNGNNDGIDDVWDKITHNQYSNIETYTYLNRKPTEYDGELYYLNHIILDTSSQGISGEKYLPWKSSNIGIWENIIDHGIKNNFNPTIFYHGVYNVDISYSKNNSGESNTIESVLDNIILNNGKVYNPNMSKDIMRVSSFIEELDIIQNYFKDKSIPSKLSISYSHLDNSNNIQTTNHVDISFEDISSVIQNSTIHEDLSNNKNIQNFFNNHFNTKPPNYIIDISDITFQITDVFKYDIDVKNILIEKYHEFLGDNSNNDYYKYVGGLNIKHEGADETSSVNIKLYDISWGNYDLSAISFSQNQNNDYTFIFTDVSKIDTSINVSDNQAITIKYIPYIITNDTDISLNRLYYEESIKDNRDISRNMDMSMNVLYSFYDEFLGANSNNDYYKYVGGLNIKHEGADETSSVNIKLYDINQITNTNKYYILKNEITTTNTTDNILSTNFTDISNPDISINVLETDTITITYIPYIIPPGNDFNTNNTKIESLFLNNSAITYDIEKDILFSYKFDDDFVNDLYDKYEKYRDDNILNNSTIESNFINKWFEMNVSYQNISTNIRLFDTSFNTTNRKTNYQIITELFDNDIILKNSKLSIKYNFKADYTNIDNLNNFMDIPPFKNITQYELNEINDINVNTFINTIKKIKDDNQAKSSETSFNASYKYYTDDFDLSNKEDNADFNDFLNDTDISSIPIFGNKELDISNTFIAEILEISIQLYSINNPLEISVNSTINSTILEKYHEFLGDNSNNDYYKYVGGINIRSEGAADAQSVNIKLYDFDDTTTYFSESISNYVSEFNTSLIRISDYNDNNNYIDLNANDKITIKYIPILLKLSNISHLKNIPVISEYDENTVNTIMNSLSEKFPTLHGGSKNYTAIDSSTLNTTMVNNLDISWVNITPSFKISYYNNKNNSFIDKEIKIDINNDKFIEAEFNRSLLKSIYDNIINNNDNNSNYIIDASYSTTQMPMHLRTNDYNTGEVFENIIYNLVGCNKIMKHLNVSPYKLNAKIISDISYNITYTLELDQSNIENDINTLLEDDKIKYLNLINMVYTIKTKEEHKTNFELIFNNRNTLLDRNLTNIEGMLDSIMIRYQNKILEDILLIYNDFRRNELVGINYIFEYSISFIHENNAINLSNETIFEMYKNKLYDPEIIEYENNTNNIDYIKTNTINTIEKKIVSDISRDIYNYTKDHVNKNISNIEIKILFKQMDYEIIAPYIKDASGNFITEQSFPFLYKYYDFFTYSHYKYTFTDFNLGRFLEKHLSSNISTNIDKMNDILNGIKRANDTIICNINDNNNSVELNNNMLGIFLNDDIFKDGYKDFLTNIQIVNTTSTTQTPNKYFPYAIPINKQERTKFFGIHRKYQNDILFELFKSDLSYIIQFSQIDTDVIPNTTSIQNRLYYTYKDLLDEYTLKDTSTNIINMYFYLFFDIPNKKFHHHTIVPKKPFPINTRKSNFEFDYDINILSDYKYKWDIPIKQYSEIAPNFEFRKIPLILNHEHMNYFIRQYPELITKDSTTHYIFDMSHNSHDNATISPPPNSNIIWFNPYRKSDSNTKPLFINTRYNIDAIINRYESIIQNYHYQLNGVPELFELYDNIYDDMDFIFKTYEISGNTLTDIQDPSNNIFIKYTNNRIVQQFPIFLHPDNFEDINRPFDDLSYNILIKSHDENYVDLSCTYLPIKKHIDFYKNHSDPITIAAKHTSLYNNITTIENEFAIQKEDYMNSIESNKKYISYDSFELLQKDNYIHYMGYFDYRVSIDDAIHPDNIDQSFNNIIQSMVIKVNPYHDFNGLITTIDVSCSVSFGEISYITIDCSDIILKEIINKTINNNIINNDQYDMIINNEYTNTNNTRIILISPTVNLDKLYYDITNNNMSATPRQIELEICANGIVKLRCFEENISSEMYRFPLVIDNTNNLLKPIIETILENYDISSINDFTQFDRIHISLNSGKIVPDFIDNTVYTLNNIPKKIDENYFIDDLKHNYYDIDLIDIITNNVSEDHSVTIFQEISNIKDSANNLLFNTKDDTMAQSIIKTIQTDNIYSLYLKDNNGEYYIDTINNLSTLNHTDYKIRLSDIHYHCEPPNTILDNNYIDVITLSNKNPTINNINDNSNNIFSQINFTGQIISEHLINLTKKTTYDSKIIKDLSQNYKTDNLILYDVLNTTNTTAIEYNKIFSNIYDVSINGYKLEDNSSISFTKDQILSLIYKNPPVFDLDVYYSVPSNPSIDISNLRSHDFDLSGSVGNAPFLNNYFGKGYNLKNMKIDINSITTIDNTDTTITTIIDRDYSYNIYGTTRYDLIHYKIEYDTHDPKKISKFWGDKPTIIFYVGIDNSSNITFDYYDAFDYNNNPTNEQVTFKKITRLYKNIKYRFEIEENSEFSQKLSNQNSLFVLTYETNNGSKLNIETNSVYLLNTTTETSSIGIKNDEDFIEILVNEDESVTDISFDIYDYSYNTNNYYKNKDYTIKATFTNNDLYNDPDDINSTNHTKHVINPRNIHEECVTHSDFSGIDISLIAVGKNHTIVLDTNDILWGWGYFENKEEDFGQLGTKAENYPQKIDISKILTNTIAEYDTIKKIACGDYFNVFLTQNGDIYTNGINNKHQLGRTLYGVEYDHIIQKIEYIIDNSFIDIAVGSNHVIALKGNLDIVTWGDNDYGQLGVYGTIPMNTIPLNTYAPHLNTSNMIIDNIIEKIKISCSMNATFVYFNNLKNFIVWGDNRFNKLSITDDEYNIYTTQIINTPIENIPQETDITFDISFTIPDEYANKNYYVRENSFFIVEPNMEHRIKDLDYNNWRQPYMKPFLNSNNVKEFILNQPEVKSSQGKEIDVFILNHDISPNITQYLNNNSDITVDDDSYYNQPFLLKTSFEKYKDFYDTTPIDRNISYNGYNHTNPNDYNSTIIAEFRDFSSSNIDFNIFTPDNIIIQFESDDGLFNDMIIENIIVNPNIDLSNNRKIPNEGIIVIFEIKINNALEYLDYGRIKIISKFPWKIKSINKNNNQDNNKYWFFEKEFKCLRNKSISGPYIENVISSHNNRIIEITYSEDIKMLDGENNFEYFSIKNISKNDVSNNKILRKTNALKNINNYLVEFFIKNEFTEFTPIKVLSVLSYTHNKVTLLLEGHNYTANKADEHNSGLRISPVFTVNPIVDNSNNLWKEVYNGNVLIPDETPQEYLGKIIQTLFMSDDNANMKIHISDQRNVSDISINHYEYNTFDKIVSKDIFSELFDIYYVQYKIPDVNNYKDTIVNGDLFLENEIIETSNFTNNNFQESNEIIKTDISFYINDVSYNALENSIHIDFNNTSFDTFINNNIKQHKSLIRVVNKFEIVYMNTSDNYTNTTTHNIPPETYYQEKIVNLFHQTNEDIDSSNIHGYCISRIDNQYEYFKDINSPFLSASQLENGGWDYNSMEEWDKNIGHRKLIVQFYDTIENINENNYTEYIVKGWPEYIESRNDEIDMTASLNDPTTNTNNIKENLNTVEKNTLIYSRQKRNMIVPMKSPYSNDTDKAYYYFEENSIHTMSDPWNPDLSLNEIDNRTNTTHTLGSFGKLTSSRDGGWLEPLNYELYYLHEDDQGKQTYEKMEITEIERIPVVWKNNYNDDAHKIPSDKKILPDDSVNGPFTRMFYHYNLISVYVKETFKKYIGDPILFYKGKRFKNNLNNKNNDINTGTYKKMEIVDVKLFTYFNPVISNNNVRFEITFSKDFYMDDSILEQEIPGNYTVRFKNNYGKLFHVEVMNAKTSYKSPRIIDLILEDLSKNRDDFYSINGLDNSIIISPTEPYNIYSVDEFGIKNDMWDTPFDISNILIETDYTAPYITSVDVSTNTSLTINLSEPIILNIHEQKYEPFNIQYYNYNENVIDYFDMDISDSDFIISEKNKFTTYYIEDLYKNVNILDIEIENSINYDSISKWSFNVFLDSNENYIDNSYNIDMSQIRNWSMVEYNLKLLYDNGSFNNEYFDISYTKYNTNKNIFDNNSGLQLDDIKNIINTNKDNIRYQELLSIRLKYKNPFNLQGNYNIEINDELKNYIGFYKSTLNPSINARASIYEFISNGIFNNDTRIKRVYSSIHDTPGSSYDTILEHLNNYMVQKYNTNNDGIKYFDILNNKIFRYMILSLTKQFDIKLRNNNKPLNIYWFSEIPNDDISKSTYFKNTFNTYSRYDSYGNKITTPNNKYLNIPKWKNYEDTPYYLSQNTYKFENYWDISLNNDTPSFITNGYMYNVEKFEDHVVYKNLSDKAIQDFSANIYEYINNSKISIKHRYKSNLYIINNPDSIFENYSSTDIFNNSYEDYVKNIIHKLYYSKYIMDNATNHNIISYKFLYALNSVKNNPNYSIHYHDDISQSDVKLDISKNSNTYDISFTMIPPTNAKWYKIGNDAGSNSDDNKYITDLYKGINNQYTLTNKITKVKITINIKRAYEEFTFYVGKFRNIKADFIDQFSPGNAEYFYGGSYRKWASEYSPWTSETMYGLVSCESFKCIVKDIDNNIIETLDVSYNDILYDSNRDYVIDFSMSDIPIPNKKFSIDIEIPDLSNVNNKDSGDSSTNPYVFNGWHKDNTIKIEYRDTNDNIVDSTSVNIQENKSKEIYPTYRHIALYDSQAVNMTMYDYKGETREDFGIDIIKNPTNRTISPNVLIFGSIHRSNNNNIQKITHYHSNNSLYYKDKNINNESIPISFNEDYAKDSKTGIFFNGNYDTITTIDEYVPRMFDIFVSEDMYDDIKYVVLPIYIYMDINDTYLGPFEIVKNDDEILSLDLDDNNHNSLTIKDNSLNQLNYIIDNTLNKKTVDISGIYTLDLNKKHVDTNFAISATQNVTGISSEIYYLPLNPLNEYLGDTTIYSIEIAKRIKIKNDINNNPDTINTEYFNEIKNNTIGTNKIRIKIDITSRISRNKWIWNFGAHYISVYDVSTNYDTSEITSEIGGTPEKLDNTIDGATYIHHNNITKGTEYWYHEQDEHWAVGDGDNPIHTPHYIVNDDTGEKTYKDINSTYNDPHKYYVSVRRAFAGWLEIELNQSIKKFK